MLPLQHPAHQRLQLIATGTASIIIFLHENPITMPRLLHEWDLKIGNAQNFNFYSFIKTFTLFLSTSKYDFTELPIFTCLKMQHKNGPFGPPSKFTAASYRQPSLAYKY